MIAKCALIRFIKRIIGCVKRKFSRNPRRVPVDEFEYHENNSEFNCQICFNDVRPRNGIILKTCGHEVCKTCIYYIIRDAMEAEIGCPHENCPGVVTDREIRCFISYENYQRLLDRSLTQAEMIIKNTFHCKTLNCPGWVEITSKRIKKFKCQVCEKTNCIPCDDIHDNLTCKQFLEQRKTSNNMKTNLLIDKLKKEHIIKPCPECQVLIEKNHGCNHMKCTQCNKEFTWTRISFGTSTDQNDTD